MDPNKSPYIDRRTGTAIDPWDPEGPALAVMRIRETSASVADDPHESITYTIADPRTQAKERQPLPAAAP